MTAVKALAPAALYRRCSEETLVFATTDELETLDEPIGQPRAVEALRFAVNMDRPGYNIFAFGPANVGKRSLVEQALSARAAQRPVPDDLCYINNFGDPNRPRALKLPAGRGVPLERQMDAFIGELRTVLPAAFESEEYRNKRQGIEDEFAARQQRALETLRERGRALSLSVQNSPTELVFAPLGPEGNELANEEFQQLPEAERQHLEQSIETLQKEAREIFAALPIWDRQRREQVQTLDRAVAHFVSEHLLASIKQDYADAREVAEFIESVQRDIVAHIHDLIDREESGEPGAAQSDYLPLLRRYRVNALVDHSHTTGAPVVYEDNPTFANLLGRIEHRAEWGAMTTDFNLIKPGALHRANGGFLLLDATQLLAQPYAWDGLKRVLKSGQLRIESLERQGVSPMSLEPEPVNLDVKVALLGDRQTYYMLSEADLDFDKLFKVAADFAEYAPRTADNEMRYARLLATLVCNRGLRPFDRSGVARVIEHCARLSEDAERLSTSIRDMIDILVEADYWAGQLGGNLVAAEHVQRALDAEVYRSGRIGEQVREQIVRGTILIDTSGEVVGQINGLSVMQVGRYSFGSSSRITARVRMGRGEVLDIEREVEMGGPTHSKGVLILSGFLAGRYAAEKPLALAASLVFEQSYGGVDGDSASSTELYALLSAISGAPVRQGLAVTGSVNQYGQVQAIGGVNEKIEGFFDLCSARGLTGQQGVLIPAANVVHLMLCKDVVDAVRADRFHIYPIEHIDEGIELLTGVVAGAADEKGHYPPDSINGRVQARLDELAQKRQAMALATGERL